MTWFSLVKASHVFVFSSPAEVLPSSTFTSTLQFVCNTISLFCSIQTRPDLSFPAKTLSGFRHLFQGTGLDYAMYRYHKPVYRLQDANRFDLLGLKFEEENNTEHGLLIKAPILIFGKQERSSVDTVLTWVHCHMHNTQFYFIDLQVAELQFLVPGFSANQTISMHSKTVNQKGANQEPAVTEAACATEIRNLLPRNKRTNKFSCFNISISYPLQRRSFLFLKRNLPEFSRLDSEVKGNVIRFKYISPLNKSFSSSWIQANRLCQDFTAPLPSFTKYSDMKLFISLIKSRTEFPLIEGVFIGLFQNQSVSVGFFFCVLYQDICF